MSKPPVKHPEEGCLLTVADVAWRCQVSQRTVRRWIANGDLKVTRIGRLIRIRKSDLENFFDGVS